MIRERSSVDRRFAGLAQPMLVLSALAALVLTGCRSTERPEPHGPPAVKMVSVKSSAMTAVGYEPDTRTLRIRFIQDADYDYSGVPPEVYQGMLSAESRGKYYHKHIKCKYRSKRVR